MHYIYVYTHTYIWKNIYMEIHIQGKYIERIYIYMENI